METVRIRVWCLELGVQSSKFIVILMLLCSATSVEAASWQWIDGQRVQNKIKEGSGLWLIDVRSAAAFEAAHIEGSVNISADALAHKKFPPQKTLILADDALGQRSARVAAEALVKQGHEQVFVLEGGISLWKIEGLPLVEHKTSVRGVTADDLKWALAQSVSMKLYDLRDAKEKKQGAIQKSESVGGKTSAERIEKLRKILSGDKKKKELAAKMIKPQPVVLVFSASEDAERNVEKVLQGMNMDVRYLIGGYEAMVSEKLRGQQSVGACPTCPGKGK